MERREVSSGGTQGSGGGGGGAVGGVEYLPPTLKTHLFRLHLSLPPS